MVRIRMYGTTGHTWSAYLYQGTTLVKTLVSGSAVPSGYTTYSYTLTSGEADSISDYGDLRVRIVANGSASGRDYVTWVEMEVPDVLVQKTGSAVISGRGYVLVAVAKLALAAAAFGILGHVLAAGEQTFNANISGGWSGDAIYGRKNGFNALVKEVADSFNYPDNQILPSPPWVKMYSLGGDEGLSRPVHRRRLDHARQPGRTPLSDNHRAG